MKTHIRHYGIALLVLLACVVAGAGAFIYSGLYNIGADDPHTRPVFALLQTLRERSIRMRSRDIQVPDLQDPQRILQGAGQYAAMCTDCHLAPGKTDSEIRPGLYPQPPDLSRVRLDPRAAFWTIKHGIKASAMPAWGFSHDDATIWSMVAFVQKLPGMTPAQYKEIVARAPPDEDMKMPTGTATGETGACIHGYGEVAVPAPQSTTAMPGMAMPVDTGHGHVAAAPISLDDLKPKAAPQAEAVAEAFHAALQKGDRAAVLALLAPDVSIREGGQVQSRETYANGRLGEDIAFLHDARITPVSLASMPMGDTAVVGSERDITTIDNGKSSTLRSRELLKLGKVGGEWKIVAIQRQSALAPGR